MAKPLKVPFNRRYSTSELNSLHPQLFDGKRPKTSPTNLKPSTQPLDHYVRTVEQHFGDQSEERAACRPCARGKLMPEGSAWQGLGSRYRRQEYNTHTLTHTTCYSLFLARCPPRPFPADVGLAGAVRGLLHAVLKFVVFVFEEFVLELGNKI